MWMQQRQLSEPERNLPSALLSVVFIIIVAVAISYPHWFYLRGGKCSEKFIGLQPFHYFGKGTYVPSDVAKDITECVSPFIINIHRCIVFLCFLAMLCAVIQFFFDIVGVEHKYIKVARQNAVATIISVILLVIVIGLCYYAAEMMKAEQEKTKLIPTVSVEVDFADSYYVIIGAGVVGVIAVGTNLLRCYSYNGTDGGEVLLDDCHRGQDEIFSVALPHSHMWTNFRHPAVPELPPPPPYTP